MLTSLSQREDNKVLNHRERSEGLEVIQSFPLVAKIEVTTKCNLRCTMCSISYREGSGSHIDFHSFLKLKPIFPYLISAYLYGVGEPLLHPRITDMFFLLADAGVRVGIITNGILISEDRVHEWLTGGLYKLSISMDGASKTVYERIRRQGSFDQLLDNLECFHSLRQAYHGPVPILTLNFVAMRENVKELLPLLEIAATYDAQEVIVTELLAFVDEMKSQVLSYEDPLLTRTYSRAEALAHELGIDLVLPRSYRRWRNSRPRFANREVLDTTSGKKCEIPFASCTEPWSGFWLTQNGNVTPCCYWFRSLGNLNDNEFIDIWNNSNYQSLRRDINHPETRHTQCRTCPIPI